MRYLFFIIYFLILNFMLLKNNIHLWHININNNLYNLALNKLNLLNNKEKINSIC